MSASRSKRRGLTGKKPPTQKRGRGRPRLFTSPTKMGKRLDLYFRACDKKQEPYTMAGMCVWLGFVDRHALGEYEKRPGFSAIVKKAKQRVIALWERRLHAPQATGAIFWLKNHAGYRDEQKIEHSGPDGGPMKVTVIQIVD